MQDVRPSESVMLVARDGTIFFGMIVAEPGDVLRCDCAKQPLGTCALLATEEDGLCNFCRFYGSGARCHHAWLVDREASEREASEEVVASGA